MAGDSGIAYLYWDTLKDLGSFGRGLTRVSRDYYINIVKRYDAVSFLDLGCGFGDTYGLFQQKGIKIYYVGWDVTPSFVYEARKRYPEIDFRVGRMQEIPYSGGSFEIVTCRCVLEHLPEPEPAILEMARVSSKAVVIVWFKWPGENERIKYDKRGFWENDYSRERIFKCADSAGLLLIDELTVKHHLVWTLEKQ